MNTRLLAPALCALLAAAPAAAADRSFTVTGFDRVRIDGPYSVQLKTGVAPFAKASGTPAAIDGVSIEVQGRTLVVRKNPSNWSSYPGQSNGPLEISLGTHELGTVWLNGAGALAIDKAKGLSFEIAIQGPGSVRVASMDVDQAKVGVIGTGSAILAGRAARVNAVVRGPSTLDAASLTVKDATIGAEGSAVVKMSVTNAATVETQGTAAVDLLGRPACTVKAAGSATVTGCR